MKESRNRIVTRYLRAHGAKPFKVISKMIKREEGLRVSTNELAAKWSMMIMGINKR